MKDMTTGSPAKHIIKFAIPILLGNMLQLTYNLADTRIIGSFLGDSALAAVGATTVLSMLYLGFMIGLVNGFAMITARFFGSKDMQSVRVSFLTAFALGIATMIVFAVLTLVFLGPIMSFLNVPDDLRPEAATYIRIIIAGLIISVTYNVLLASARAIGDSFTPLLTLFLSVGLNITGDILMIGVIGTGVWGAAAATIASQFITMIICAIYILKKYEFYRIKRSDFHLMSYVMAKDMMLAGISMGLMNSLIGFGSLILQTAINGLGASYIVAQSAARRITDVLMTIFVAIGNTMATFCSQNFGAGKYDRIMQGMRAGYIITSVWCIFVILIVYTLAPALIQLITGSSDQIMIDAATLYLRIDSILYVLVAIIFVQRYSLQSVGDRITPLISSGIEMAGKIILTVTLVRALGYFGVILVEPIVWIVMIIPLIWKVRKWEKQVK